MKKFYSSSPFVHFVSYFIIGLFISWFVSLIQDGWSLRLFLNFPIVIFFLLFSYLLEVKTELTNYSKGIFYGGFFLALEASYLLSFTTILSASNCCFSMYF
ncbi:hypothetical protein KQI33_06480 [Enterococcus devriesei]|uniref:hypothetical protein n=1 Tax=Enterococcus devriesei TaxID=319970 RepID=UPI001C0FC197|nr:hypothetical protein [Enterococcus devriesei]MBU5365014.1 hypothetical protein [Enterococcus devriesei]